MYGAVACNESEEKIVAGVIGRKDRCISILQRNHRDGGWMGANQVFLPGLKRAIAVPQHHLHRACRLIRDDQVQVAVMIQIGIGEKALLRHRQTRYGRLEGSVSAAQQHPDFVRGPKRIQGRDIQLAVPVEIRSHQCERVWANGIINGRAKAAIPFAEQYGDLSRPCRHRVRERQIGDAVTVKVSACQIGIVNRTDRN